jgi:transposase
VRVCTAFNKILALRGTTVASVTFAPEGIVVACGPADGGRSVRCGWKGRGIYDRRVRRWRHLDLGGTKLWLEADVRRLECRRCDRVRR